MIQIFFFFSAFLLHSSNSFPRCSKHSIISTGYIKFSILALFVSKWKREKFSERANAISRLGPLFLSQPGLLPFTRLQFPFRFEELTRVEEYALFQKKVQTLVKTPLHSANSAEIKAEDSFVFQRVKKGASKARPRKLRGGRCCASFFGSGRPRVIGLIDGPIEKVKTESAENGRH